MKWLQVVSLEAEPFAELHRSFIRRTTSTAPSACGGGRPGREVPELPPDRRQIQRKLGPAWTEGGRPANGYFTKRTAKDWLRMTLEHAHRGALPGQVQTGATVADAGDDFRRYVTEDRRRTPSTLAGYRSITDSPPKPAFEELPIESVTTEATEAWLTGLPHSARTKAFALVLSARHRKFPPRGGLRVGWSDGWLGQPPVTSPGTR